MPQYTLHTLDPWTGSNAKAGALWLNATRGLHVLETTVLGKVSRALSNPVLKATGNAEWAQTMLYKWLWGPVSKVYGFRAGVSGHALVKLIQTDLPIPQRPGGFGSIFRTIEAPAYRAGQALRAFGRAAGPALRVLGGVASVVGLIENIQSGDVASGVGNALGLAAATVPGPAGRVLAAGALGYAVGTLIDQYAVQPAVDRWARGSGAAGDWWLTGPS